MEKRLPHRKRTRSRTRKTSKTTRKPRRRRRGRTTKSTEGPLSPPVAVYLGLGSNLGERKAYLEDALSQISRIAPLLSVSSFYLTDPVGCADQPKFLNLAARIVWSGSPEALLEALKLMERQIGRTRSLRDGPREIDVDILDFGGWVRKSPDPVLPHPRLALRRFVLVPLKEIAPRWRHPVTGESLREMIAKLPRKPGVARFGRKAGVGVV